MEVLLMKSKYLFLVKDHADTSFLSKNKAVVSTALSPLSWCDAIPIYILTIKYLWFAPGLFYFRFILLDGKIKAPLELGNVLPCLL